MSTFRTRAARRAPWIVGLFVVLGLVALAAWKEKAPRTIVPFGGYVRNDDFAFTVASCRRERGPNSGTDRFVLDVECQNRAVRVPFTFKPEMVRVFGKQLLSPAPDTWAGDTVLNPGRGCHQTVVVTGPDDLDELGVQFRISGASGDFLDALFDTTYELRVPVK